MTNDTPRTVSAMSLKQNYDLSEKNCPVYENYVHAEVCAQIERELTASQAEVDRLKEAMISCLHITNCYDGNYARACDNVELIIRNALISLTPDKTNQ